MNLLKKKRKNNDVKNDKINNDLKKNEFKKVRGRKKAEDQTKRFHNKKCADNIIKKIKGYFIELLIIFVNAIINKEEKNGFKPLDYKKNIDKIKKEEDLKLLRTTVKDYLYQDISTKYFKTEINWNKNLINSILKDQKDN